MKRWFFVLAGFLLAVKVSGADPFRFVQITDTHHGMSVHAARLDKAIDQINRLPFPVAFVLHTGDFASDNLRNAAEAISNSLSRINVPVLKVAGNHDILPNRLNETVAAYTNYLGDLCFRYETNGVQFLGLFTEPLRKEYVIEGYDPLAWLGEQLDANPTMPTIIVHHSPDTDDFYNNKVVAGWPEAPQTKWRETLKRGKVEAIITGHFHRDELHFSEDGIPTYVAAGMASFWGRQGTFRIYTYRDGRLSYQTVYIEDPP
ncbi:MAG: metallophosphoesterase [Kiritimatiellaeota bacterium]|nr:metallophosphoesterase [Kiritimatiellota bacterium]